MGNTKCDWCGEYFHMSLAKDIGHKYYCSKKCEAEAKAARKQSKGESSGCFIATAVYDSPYAQEVVVLKKYRDEVLLKSIAGKVFVQTYYFCSPPIAKLISHSKLLKRITLSVVLKPILNLINFKK